MKINCSKCYSLRLNGASGSEVIDSELKVKSGSENKPQDVDGVCGFFASGESVSFRPITTADLDEVMVIERTSFRFPWSSGFFLQELQVACARSILAEIDGQIVGYVLFWLLPGAIDIHNIAVHVDYRRRGIARLLLNKVLAEARNQSAVRVMLEVRRSNWPAQKLYQSLGFLATGVRKGYYSDDGEDAVAMTLDLPSET